MYPRRVGRLPGFEYIGRFTYFLTLCTFARRHRVLDARVVAETDRIFRAAGDRWAFQVLAYCYMPDHLHLVVEGASNDADLVRFVKDGKQRSGYWYARHFSEGLWQAGWFDHIVRDNESVERHVCYTLANPVRAGLIDRWDRWPYSGTSIPVSDEDFQRVLRPQA